MAGHQPQRTTDRHEMLPQIVTTGGVAQVDLIAQFARPPGARNNKGNAIEVELR